MLLDLTDVQETGAAIEPGEHEVVCEAATVEQTKSGTGKYIKATFRTKAGQLLWHMFNIENPNKTATNIGRGQLKAFMRVAGHGPQLSDVGELLGLTCLVNVKMKDDDYGTKPVITTFKARPATKQSNPFA